MRDVRELLRAATAGATPPPDLLDRTLRRAARRERRRRLVSAVVAVVCVGAVTVPLWIAFRPSDQGSPSFTPGTTPAPGASTSGPSATPHPPRSTPGSGSPTPGPTDGPESPGSATPELPPPFIPPTTPDGDTVVMPVVFPDGTTATLRFPSSLDLAGMGVSPELGYYLGRGGDTAGPYPIVLVHGDTTAGLVTGDAPIATFDDPGGRVELWESAPDADGLSWPTTAWLVDRLDHWTVLTYLPEYPNDAAAREGAAQVAAALEPREAPAGFVVVEGDDPVRISPDYGEGLGAELAFGDRDPRTSFARTDEGFRMVEVTAARWPCHPSKENIGGDTRYASACIGDGPDASLFVAINGPASFVRSVVDGLEASDVRISKI